jgi:hypothetical protein
VSEIKLRWPESVPHTERNEQFLQSMLDAMAVSFHKYGPVAKAYPEKRDALKDARVRLMEYQKTGDMRFLVDVANFAMIEAMHPGKEEAGWPEEDKPSPGRVDRSTGALTLRDNDNCSPFNT